MSIVWIIMGDFGEYDARRDVPLRAYATEVAAEAMCAKLSDIAKRAREAAQAWDNEHSFVHFMSRPRFDDRVFRDEAGALGFGLADSYEVDSVELEDHP